MMYKSKKSNLIIAIILFLVAAIFLVYGIYMVNYSIDYIRTYMEISTISPDNAFQYVVTSSAVYFGFAIVIFIGGMIIFSTRKVYYDPNDPKADKRSVRSGKNKNEETGDSDTDAHPENNPYYTVPESITESPQATAAPGSGVTFAKEVERITDSPDHGFEESDMSGPEKTSDAHGNDADKVSGAYAGINAAVNNNAAIDASDASDDDIERFLLDELEPIKATPVIKQAAPSIKYHEPVIEPAPQQQTPLKQEATTKHEESNQLNLRQQVTFTQEKPVVSNPEERKEHIISEPERKLSIRPETERKATIIPDAERKAPIIPDSERKADISLNPEHNTAHPQQKKEEHISGLDIKNIFENL